MDENKYTEKSILLYIENNLRNLTMTLRKWQKRRFKEYWAKLNPSYRSTNIKSYIPWLSPGKFYSTAKIHKVPENGNIDQLLSDLLCYIWLQLHTN